MNFYVLHFYYDYEGYDVPIYVWQGKPSKEDVTKVLDERYRDDYIKSENVDTLLKYGVARTYLGTELHLTEVEGEQVNV